MKWRCATLADRNNGAVCGDGKDRRMVMTEQDWDGTKRDGEGRFNQTSGKQPCPRLHPLSNKQNEM